MRHNKSLLMIGLIILSSVFQFGQTSKIGDEEGNWWITTSFTDRLHFIQGFIVGVSLMNEKAIQPFKKYDLPKDEVAALAVWIITASQSTAENLALYQISVGQILDGVSAFYKDFSVRKIKVVDAIYVVKMQINGADPDLISAQIRYLKQQPISADEQIKVWDKAKPFDHDFEKCFAAGKITAEDLFRIGFFINKDNKLLPLFHYGNY